MFNFLHPSRGLVNITLAKLGLDMVNFTGDPNKFRLIYVLCGVWQTTGYSAIIYISALAGVSPELIEAGVIDGTSRLQKIWYVDLPCIAPTITIMLILAMGAMFNVGFEKVYLMQNPLNIDRSEIISTYVYKRGLLDIQYSYSTAIGLFNSVINTALLLLSNQIVKKTGGSSLF
jgi:ABC-type polysaccharide transport system permease subunit